MLIESWLEVPGSRTSHSSHQKHRNNDYWEFEGIILLKDRVLIQFEEDKQHASERSRYNQFVMICVLVDCQRISINIFLYIRKWELNLDKMFNLFWTLNAASSTRRTNIETFYFPDRYLDIISTSFDTNLGRQ